MTQRLVVFTIAILEAVLSIFATTASNSVNAQNLTGNETRTNMTNATMGGNMIGPTNMTNTSTPIMTNS